MNIANRYAINLDDIRSAAARIGDHTIRTPVVSSQSLNDSLHSQVFFKCENLQHIGAFKARGACNAVLSLSEERASAGVVTHSSGNHAAALARAAKIRGIQAHIVMPHDSAAVKLAAVRSLGVDPTFSEPDSESRQAVADSVIKQTGATFIHPFDNADVMAGQGTVAMELLEQVPELDIIVAPVGGGGLLSGILVAAKSINPSIQVIAAEPEWADDAYRSLQSGKIESPTRYDTIADGLRTLLGELTFPIIRDLVDGVLLVSEQSIRLATRAILQQAKVVAEPSGAVSLAAVMSNTHQFEGKRVGVIISGGNVQPEILAQILKA